MWADSLDRQGEQFDLSKRHPHAVVNRLFRRRPAPVGAGLRVTIFAHSAWEAQCAVGYVKQQHPQLSVHLLATQTPPPETIALCTRVLVVHRPLELWMEL